jgi:hypothetical protein
MTSSNSSREPTPHFAPRCASHADASSGQKCGTGGIIKRPSSQADGDRAFPYIKHDEAVTTKDTLYCQNALVHWNPALCFPAESVLQHEAASTLLLFELVSYYPFTKE